MKSSFLASLLLAAVLGAGGAIVLTHATPAQAAPSEVSGDTVTVFVDATLGVRKKHMAKQLSKSLGDYAARG
jgi:hypothetical protein